MASNNAETSTKRVHRPPKGILKTSTSFEKHSTPVLTKSTKFDEMNVQLTHHPADKDYGHMKINEPKTPFIREDTYLDADQLDADVLAEKLKKTLSESEFMDEPSDGEEEEQIAETEEELQKRLEFERRRKLHYNEFEAVRRARQLMEQDELDDEIIDMDEAHAAS